MDGLINTTLIKSAKYDFASANVDGNSLFIGANGAGKTTFLRAILFFYLGNSEGLGINKAKKISFSDYYFPFENSYMVYTYKKDKKYILVIAYKDGNIKFNFALFNEMPNIKEIFVEEDNKPIELGKLRLKLKEISNLSNIIQNGAKYREILYSKNTKEKEFSLFEAKEYDSFTRTLSNIFVNSKVDSNSIKKVIVSSLNLDTFIDISQLQRYLKDFNLIYEDILKYEKSSKDILKVIASLKDYEQTKVFMKDEFKTLFSSKEFVINLIKNLEDKFKNKKISFDKQKENFKKVKNIFEKKKENFIGKNAQIKDFLKKCDEKKEYYEKLNIEGKIEEYSKKSTYEEKLGIEISNKDFLTKEHKQLEENHQNQIERIKNSFVSLKNHLDKQIFDLENEQKDKIHKIQKNQNEVLNEIKKQFNQKRLDFKDQQSNLKTQKQELGYRQKEKEKEKYIFKQSEEKDKLNEELKQNLQVLKDKREGLKNLDIELKNKEELYFLSLEMKTKEFDKIIENINERIEKLQKTITPIKGSLIYEIYENSSNKESYLYFLKDEVLHSKIDFEFKDFENRFFELDLKTFEVPISNLALQIEKLKIEFNQKQKEKAKNLESLGKEFTLFQNRIYKEKRELNESLKELEINQKLLEVKINKLELDKQKEMKDFENLKEERLKILSEELELKNEEIRKLNKEFDNLIRLEENEIKVEKTQFTKKMNLINESYLESFRKFENQLLEIEKNKKLELENQENNYKGLLKSKNIDIKRLEFLENEISKLESKLKELNSYYEKIVEYNKDKKEYFEKESEKRKEQKSLKDGFSKIEDEFSKFENENDFILKVLNEKINSLEKELIQKNNDLKNIQNFEKNPTFQRYKSLGFIYEEKGSVKENISDILNSLDTLRENEKNGYDKIQNQIKNLNHLFDNSLGIKRVLDDIDTAYILKEYFEQNSINKTKELLGENIDKIIKFIVSNYDKLLDSQGQIKTLINKITKLFSSINISVIDSLELRYQESNNKIIEIINKIKSENEENSFGFGENLFSSSNDSHKLVKILRDLVDVIEYENISKVDLEDSFILEFRVVENGNDSKWLNSLDMIGSNGTDVLVKSMIYVAMLHIFKIQSTKKELIIQVVLDEVGILSQRYLKELIDFANKFGILFVNGAPDEKLIGTYKRVSLISNINSKPVLKELIIK